MQFEPCGMAHTLQVQLCSVLHGMHAMMTGYEELSMLGKQPLLFDSLCTLAVSYESPDGHQVGGWGWLVHHACGGVRATVAMPCGRLRGMLSGCQW